MFNVISRAKRPLLALGLLFGLGTGAVSAYDTCSACTSSRSRPVVVRTEPVYVRTYTTTVSECSVCEPPRRVYRSRPRVVYEEVPTVVYRRVPTVVYEEQAVEVVTTRRRVLSPCSSCP